MLFKDMIYMKYHKPLEEESLKLLENMVLVLRGHVLSHGKWTHAISAFFPSPSPPIRVQKYFNLSREKYSSFVV